jgi:inhibitor of cysteine peptidase
MAALLVVASLAACAPGETRVTKSDDGGRVSLRVGQTLVVELPGNPSTGYSWTGGGQDGVLVPSGEPEFVADSEMLGSPGTVVLRFEAARPGETRLSLAYERSWETTEPIDTFSLAVTVEP